MTEATESTVQAHKNRIRGAARGGQKDQAIGMMLQLMSMENPFDLAFCDEVVKDELLSRGKREDAGELLFRVAVKLEEAGNVDEAFRLLRKAANCAPRLDGLRDRLVEHYRRVHGASGPPSRRR